MVIAWVVNLVLELHNMLKDDSIMPWGIHKGKKMANVPDDYLLYLWENGKCSGEVKLYIKKNLEVIKSNINMNLKPDWHKNG